jgi:hypothetical protein
VVLKIITTSANFLVDTLGNALLILSTLEGIEMICSAVKRSLDEVEYKQHACIDDDPRGAFVDALHYLGRPYRVGDRILLDSGWVEVSETFDGFDFHTNEPCRCYNTEKVCRNCHNVGNHHMNNYDWAPFTCEKAA